MNIRNRVCACLWPALIMLASSASAGGEVLAAYSHSDCSVWNLESVMPEDLVRPQSALSATPRLRQALTANLQIGAAKGLESQLFRGQAFPKKKNQEPKADQVSEMGCVRLQKPLEPGNESTLQCYLEAGNRIVTYVFQGLPKQKKDDLESYGCQGDCPGYPVLVVHETPWEDGRATRRQKRASAEYAKRCL